MAIEEWWWVFDAHYIKSMKAQDENYTTQDEWEELRQMHREKYG